MKKCVICGKHLQEDICEICFDVLDNKYPKTKDLKEAIKWHKENLKEIQEE